MRHKTLVPHSASLRGERGAEPVPLPVAPLRENQGHETDRFAAAQPRVLLLVAATVICLIFASSSIFAGNVKLPNIKDSGFSSPAAENSFIQTGQMDLPLSTADKTKALFSTNNDNRHLLAYRSTSCSTSCSTGCSSGCSYGCSSGCSSGCSYGCSVGCSVGCQ